MTLVIGNKNYSSWSMRPWLVLKYFKIPFKEILIPLYEGDYKSKVLKYSPSGKVPLLKDGAFAVWDSLSICEYLAEKFSRKNLWPKDQKACAVARSICAEMHSGFMALRKNCPMDVRITREAFEMTPEAKRDGERIAAIWNDCRRRFGKSDKFLFGAFSVADAFYAPVVWRFHTYGFKLTGAVDKYFDAMLALPAMKEWQASAKAEPWVIEH